MKKIVGILAAAAVLATSVFAADVSATAKVSSDLFKFDTKSGAMTVLGTLNNAQTASYATLFSLQFSADKAGGGVKYWGDNTDGKVKFGSYNVWFKPTDNLKLSFRENERGLFGDKYHGYYANDVGKVKEGYSATVSLDAITIDFNLCEDLVIKAGNNADAKIGELGAKLSYNADFGSIAALFDAYSNFQAFKIGAGFSGNFEGIGVVVNAGADINGNAIKIGINPSAGGNVDAISWAIDVPVYIEPNKTSDVASVGLNAKAGYQFEPAKCTLYFEDGNLLANKFAAKIGLAIEGNIGGAAWKVDPNYDLGSDTFKIAFEAGIGF